MEPPSFNPRPKLGMGWGGHRHVGIGLHYKTRNKVGRGARTYMNLLDPGVLMIVAFGFVALGFFLQIVVAIMHD